MHMARWAAEVECCKLQTTFVDAVAVVAKNSTLAVVIQVLVALLLVLLLLLSHAFSWTC